MEGGRLQREPHERKIHFYGLVPIKVSWSRARGKRPPVMEINGLYLDGLYLKVNKFVLNLFSCK